MKTKPILLLALLSAFVGALRADPVVGKLSIPTAKAGEYVAALTVLATAGHDEVVKQGSEADKIIHKPANFSGVVTWSLARDLAAFKAVRDDSAAIMASITADMRQLVADGHAKIVETGITSLDPIGALKISSINLAAELEAKRVVEVEVVFFFESDFKTDDNPGLAVQLAAILPLIKKQ